MIQVMHQGSLPDIPEVPGINPRGEMDLIHVCIHALIAVSDRPWSEAHSSCSICTVLSY